MDIRKIKKLIELLEESGIAEIEIQEGEESLRISRYGSSGAGSRRTSCCICSAHRCSSSRQYPGSSFYTHLYRP